MLKGLSRTIPYWHITNNQFGLCRWKQKLFNMSQGSTLRIWPMMLTTDQDDSMTFEHFLVPSCLKFFYLYLSPIPNYLKESCSSVILCVCLAISEITDVLLKTKVATLWQSCTHDSVHPDAAVHLPPWTDMLQVAPVLFSLLFSYIIYRVFHKKFHNFTVSFLRSAACVWYLETNLGFSHTKQFLRPPYI